MNFQYLEHLEVEFLNSNFNLKEAVLSVEENSTEKSINLEEKAVRKYKLRRIDSKRIA